MKHAIIFSLVCLMSSTVLAQKFAYVDTQYILSHIPEYSEAQNELNRLSIEWQEEVERKYENITRLEEAYAAEKILLTEEMKTKREEEIASKKGDAMNMQKQKFGVGGDLFNKREELIKPIQDQIYEAIKDVSGSKSYMVVFDKSNQSNMLYTNPKHDVSDQVIKKMGLKPGDIIENEDKGGSDDKGGANSPKGGSKQGTDNKGGSRGGTNIANPKGGKK
jgi:outer membrane protein